jgi:hypothetical protein
VYNKKKENEKVPLDKLSKVESILNNLKNKEVSADYLDDVVILHSGNNELVNIYEKLENNLTDNLIK